MKGETVGGGMVARCSGDRGRWGNGALGSREGSNGAREGQPDLAWPETWCAGSIACLHRPTVAAPSVRSNGG
jgi:hypothetical protein